MELTSAVFTCKYKKKKKTANKTHLMSEQIVHVWFKVAAKF